jgi:two-component system phosphate regulon sensor histidine kinase PhoR
MKGEMREFQNRIIFSMTSNKMDMERLDSIYKKELDQKEISVKYQLIYSDGDSIYTKGDSIKTENQIRSESALFYKDASLEMTYAGQSATILKRNLTGILLSAVLITAVISCLFYMLFVIRKQKELSLIKNDLISNITHEFKTPIATASAALEGVQNFTTSGDHEKSNRYLDVGREQLSKLNTMVEKLLETATIDSEKLALQRTRFDLTDLIQESVDRYQSTTGKTISTNLPESSVDFYGDEFHLENAVNNLLDNAIKYGGSIISVSTAIKNKEVVISISDNGKQLKAKDTKHLFDKFYRVPQGDTHNIKGYGIGLFYTKAIIEKHGGTISLSLNPTTFKIQLPHE